MYDSRLHFAAETSSGVETKCIVIDFAAGPEIYDKIEAELTGLDIAVLGNIASYHVERPTIGYI